MKPCYRKVVYSSHTLQTISTGPVIAKINGTIKKQNKNYKDALVVIYNRENFKPIRATKADERGGFAFLGLNTNLKIFIVAFDMNQQFNAIIQDNVVVL